MKMSFSHIVVKIKQRLRNNTFSAKSKFSANDPLWVFILSNDEMSGTERKNKNNIEK